MQKFKVQKLHGEGDDAKAAVNGFKSKASKNWDWFSQWQRGFYLVARKTGQKNERQLDTAIQMAQIRIRLTSEHQDSGRKLAASQTLPGSQPQHHRDLLEHFAHPHGPPPTTHNLFATYAHARYSGN